ncbi:MAG: 4Fe-4S dicluster domain-containing protein, partial [Polyangiaceae bacterium]|nr:4Fe-4S dicluster domain-containing protein [Polyangiaceae bacterium]
MPEVLALATVVFIALAVSLAWLGVDRSKEKKAIRELADLAAMGDVVPASLHPRIVPDQCIGSGACVHACPEKSVLALVNGRAKLANPLGCIGHGACATACPVQAIELVFGTATRGVELPRVGPQFETNQPGVYVIG